MDTQSKIDFMAIVLNVLGWIEPRKIKLDFSLLDGALVEKQDGTRARNIAVGLLLFSC